MGGSSSKIDELNKIIDRQDRIISDLKYKVELLEKSQYVQHGGSSNTSIADVEQTKKDKDYEFLTFSGGGIKGACYVGAIESLEEMGILDNMKGFAGTSAGSIIATFLALGMPIIDIKTIMNNINFEDILDDRFGVIRDCANLIDNYGICRGLFLYELLGEIIKERFGDPDLTVKQLYDIRKVSLVITATDINSMRTIYLHPHSPIDEYKNIPIRTAVRMSICIPFVFEPVRYSNDMYVDGGVLDNYPIHSFDGDYPSEYNKMNISKINSKVLGLNIITKDDETHHVDRIDNLYEYSIGFVNMFYRENETRLMTPLNKERTVVIKVPSYPLTRFNLNQEEKNELMDIGKKAVYNFFDE